MPSSGGFFSVWRIFRFRSKPPSGNRFRSGEFVRRWNLLQVENIPGLILSRRSVWIEESLPLNKRTPVEVSSLSGGFPWTVSDPVESQGNRGIASFQTRRFLWKVNRPRNSDRGSGLYRSSDSSGIAPVRIILPIQAVPRSKGFSVERRCSQLGISEEQTCVSSKDIPGRINSSAGDLRRGN
jgi:hypothetical protein